jgi:quinol monooxygenase YgiN
MSFIIVAKFTVKPEKKLEFKELITNTARLSWFEAGLIKYILVEDENQPELFTLVEFFESEEDYLSHRESPHLQQFRSQVTDLLSEPAQVVRGVPTLAHLSSKADVN